MRRGDTETRRHGDAETRVSSSTQPRIFAVSRPLIFASSDLRVPASPRLRVPPSPRLFFAVLTLLFLAAPAYGQVCATSGQDGPGGTLSGVINTYYPGTGNANAGATSIPIGIPTGSVTPISSGDLLLVIQMQDAAINSTNTSSYGDGNGGDPATGSTNLNNSGRYEYVVATSAAGGTVSIRGTNSGGLVNSYTDAASSGTQGQRRYQVVRVPQYSSATLGSGLTALPWNGTTGGVLVLDVGGNLNLGSATVSVNGMGFRGGGARQLGGGSGGTTTDYVNVSTNNFHGLKGEGIAGTPRYVYDALFNTVVDTGVEGYPNGSTARGAPGNAGGGGTDTDIAQNSENSGGGGGSNWGAGGIGGRTWRTNLDRGGHGGAAFTSATAARVIMGGGGGAAVRNNSSGTDSSGGAGGGIVMIRANTFSGSGTISANGSNGNNAANDGGGGGGAGGSVVVTANSGGLGALTINARGGRGGHAWPSQDPNGNPGGRHGPGGGGGGGFIAISGAATSSVIAGASGITTTANDTYGAGSGSAGSVLSITANQIPGANSGAECIPVLTVTKTTTTPTVVNTPTGTTATYTIVVANAANLSSASNLTLSDTLPAGFTYASTGAVTLLGGATRPGISNPAVGAAVPVWGTFLVPGGGSVSLTFTANIASSVVNATYQNPATATYTDPRRTAVNGTTSASYNSGSSTNEDVRVTASDLTINKTHSGNFTQGQVGATYSLTATNSGNVATSGTVTVTDTLPASLTATNIAGTGWTCVLATVTCTRSDALGAGASYPAITLTVTVANNAPASVTNSAAVSGGNQANTANDTDTDPTTINQLPDLTVTKTHAGNFTQGQVGATYSIVVTNSGFATTSGTVTVTDSLPVGLTATNMTGTGWNCVLATLTCTRNTTRGPGNSFPAITVTVTVAANAPASVTNSVTVSGGGQTNTTNDTANDPTTIIQLRDMTITKSHTGNFTQGQTGATYTLTATNSGSLATVGLVTVTDTLPAGLTATAISGPGWTCVLAILTCTRLNALPAGNSYPAITLTVDVAFSAPASVTNTATVAGGGETNISNNIANDPTTINPAAPPNIVLVKSVNPSGTQIPGTDLLYSIIYTNSGSQPATNFVVVDPNLQNADPLERVLRNLDFKLGTMTSAPGSSGLVATFEYSNDGGATWTYTPVSGGGSAPAGYDRNVTNVRWSFTGNLSHLAPNNTGGVELTVRIR